MGRSVMAIRYLPLIAVSAWGITLARRARSRGGRALRELSASRSAAVGSVLTERRPAWRRLPLFDPISAETIGGSRRWLLGVLVVALLAAWGAGGAGLALLVLLVAAGASLTAIVTLRGRQTRRAEADLPAVLESLAGSVRSGASLPVAVREAAAGAPGPLGEDLAGVIAAVDAGAPLAAALHHWAEERGSPRVRLAVTALTLALQCGGAEARTIDGVATTLRDRVAVEREAVALSSQARASAVVMVAAPAAFLLLTGIGDPSVGQFFLRTSFGFACLVLGLALDAVGGAWMWWIARGSS
jgi:tight adherence protein B